MKITEARAYVCDLPVQRPRRDASQSFIKQETILVEVRGETGAVGRGYSYTIGTGGRAVCELLRVDLLPELLGEDSAFIERVWRKLRDAIRATTVGPVSSLALAAVDIALWDLRGQETELSLTALAGGAQSSVPVYSTEGGWLQHSEDELIDGALTAQREGLRGVKIKIGKASASEDLRRVRIVREAIGPEMALMVDANQCFTVDEARRRARMLEPLDLAWMEEPLPSDDLAGHVELAGSTSVPIAVGESLYSLGQFRQYLELRATSIVQVDVARVGGITPWLKVAHLAEAFNLSVAPHFLMELHSTLAAAVPNGRWVEWIPQLSAITTQPVDVHDGLITPPGTPGLGIRWDLPALVTHCADGSLEADPPWTDAASMPPRESVPVMPVSA